MLTAAGVRPIHLYANFPKGNLYAQFAMPFTKLGVPPHPWGHTRLVVDLHAWWGTNTLGVLHLLIWYFSSQIQTVNTEGALLSLTLGLWMSSRGAEARNMVQF